MALIVCEDCGKEVSDKAAACVSCGAPLGGTTTIQGTSKSLKAHLVISGLLAVILGIYGIANKSDLWMGIGGLAAWWWIATKMLIWWNHK